MLQFTLIYTKLLMKGIQKMVNFVMIFKFEADTFCLKITW